MQTQTEQRTAGPPNRPTGSRGCRPSFCSSCGRLPLQGFCTQTCSTWNYFPRLFAPWPPPYRDSSSERGCAVSSPTATAPTRPPLRHHQLCFHPRLGRSRNSKFAVCVSLFLVYHPWRTETPRWGSSCHLSSGELGALDSSADPSPVGGGQALGTHVPAARPGPTHTCFVHSPESQPLPW